MAPDTAHTAHRPLGTDHGAAGIPLITLVLSGALRIHPPERGPVTEPARDDERVTRSSGRAGRRSARRSAPPPRPPRPWWRC